jgi:hypothetical protein
LSGLAVGQEICIVEKVDFGRRVTEIFEDKSGVSTLMSAVGNDVEQESRQWKTVVGSKVDRWVDSPYIGFR